MNEKADECGQDRPAWHGEMGETCTRCGVQVPAGYLLALPRTEVAGCLRCLEMQAHLFYGDLTGVPEELASIAGQQDAMRLIAQEFRQHIKAADRGREPLSRRAASSRWARQSGWEATDAWEPPGAADDGIGQDEASQAPSRWPKRPMHASSQQKPKHAKIRQPKKRPVAPAAKAAPTAADILGLTGQPSRENVMAAFRRSALVCHPDYGGSAEAFRKLVAARDALLEQC